MESYIVTETSVTEGPCIPIPPPCEEHWVVTDKGAWRVDNCDGVEREQK